MTNIKIHHPNLELPQSVFLSVDRSLQQVLDRFTHVIREAQVSLRDMNGPKGGIDKQCTVQLRLYPRGLEVVRSTGTSFPEAVNKACDKIHQVVAKRLNKRRNSARQGAQSIRNEHEGDHDKIENSVA